MKSRNLFTRDDVLFQLWTTAQDRKVIGCKTDGTRVELLHDFHSLNGFVYCAIVSPHDPNRIAIAVGDGCVRVWNLTKPQKDVEVYWQKIKGWFH